MKRIFALAAVAMWAMAPVPTWAAAPADPADEFLTTKPVAAVPAEYSLDTEMVVRDWVLCTSASSAKKMVEAHRAGLTAARTAYEELEAAKTCGRFSELKVILRAPLFTGTPSGAGDARAFAAMVDLSGNWASAFVITGSLPSE